MSSVLRRITAGPACRLCILVLLLGTFLFGGPTQVRAQLSLDALFQQKEDGVWVQTARVSFPLDKKHSYVEAVADASPSERFLDSLTHALERRPNMKVRRSRQGPRIKAAELVERRGDTPSRRLESANRAVFHYRFKIEPGAEEPYMEQIESIQFYDSPSAVTDSSRHGKPFLYLDTSEEWVHNLLETRILVRDLAPADPFSSVFHFAGLVKEGQILTIGGKSVTGDDAEKKRRNFVRLISRLTYEGW